MTCVLCDITAVQALRSIGVRGGISHDAVRPFEMPLHADVVLADARCDAHARETLQALAAAGVCSPPFYVAVPAAHRAQSTSSVVCRSMRSAPFARAFLKIADGLHVVCPSLCLAELSVASRGFGDGQLLKLAYEFCGGFTTGPDGRGEPVERRPLLSRAVLCEQLAAMGSTYGASRMRVLAPHVLDGSRSPAESCQSMLLNLPYMRGGFNLSACDPVLNPPVALVGRSALTGKRHYVPDLLYPAQKVAVEYNGRQHFDPRAASRDEARRNDFLSMGYEVWTVTWEQLADDRAFCALARGISKRLGRRVRPATASFAERRLKLRSQLFGRAC